MTTTSVLPAVKARLVDLLTQSDELSGVQVAWAPTGQVKQEVIYFAKTTGTSSVNNNAAGRQRRDEVIDFLMVIDTTGPGKKADAAELRAFELYAVVENIIANDPSLNQGLSQNAAGVDGVLSAYITNFTAGPDPDIEGYSGLVVCTVQVTARLN